MSINKSTAKSFETSSQVDQKQERKGNRLLRAAVVPLMAVAALTACSATHAETPSSPASHSTEATSTPKAVTEIMPTQAQLESVVLPANPTDQQIGEFYDNFQNLVLFGEVSNPNLDEIVTNEQMASIKENGGKGDTPEQATTKIATGFTKQIFENAVASSSNVMDVNAYKANLISLAAQNMQAGGDGTLKASWTTTGVIPQTTGVYLITQKLSYQHPGDSNDTAISSNGETRTSIVGITDGKIYLDRQQSVTPAS